MICFLFFSLFFNFVIAFRAVLSSHAQRQHDKCTKVLTGLANVNNCTVQKSLATMLFWTQTLNVQSFLTV